MFRVMGANPVKHVEIYLINTHTLTRCIHTIIHTQVIDNPFCLLYYILQTNDEKHAHIWQDSFGIGDVMKGMLNTTGPVCNRDTTRSNKLLRSLKSAQFVEAATELERLHLGKLVTLAANQGKGYASYVFVKKSPDEAAQVLSANPDLCSLDVYSERYNKPPSKSIGFILRARLVAMKLVPKQNLM